MNAIKFIQQHGVEKAREIVEGIPSKYMSCYYSTLCYCTKSNKYSDRFAPRESLVNMGWLKRLVESVDCIKSYGGIINAKHDVKYLDLDWDYDTPRVTRLKQAIADYEAIYSDSDIGDDSHIENHISKNCKVIDYE